MKSYLTKQLLTSNIGRDKDLSTLKSDIHLGLAVCLPHMSTSLKSIIVYCCFFPFGSHDTELRAGNTF